MKYELSDLIDIEKNQKLLDSFCDAVGIAAAIIDLDGKVLVGSRWQKICTEFHRVNKRTCEKCIESDTQLANELKQGKCFSIYQCRNGLTDAASPIIIEGEHVANTFIGQFFLEKPDQEFFRRQASTYGFEEASYLDALSSVPIVKEETLPAILNFLTNFAEMVAKMGLDRKKQLEAQEALRESEEKYRQLVENAGECIFVAQDGRLAFHNPKTEELIGYSKEEIAFRPFTDFIHPDDQNLVLERHKQRLRGEELPDIYDFRVVRKSGEVRWVELNAVLIEWEGRPATLNFLSDITSRKRAEEELRVSDEKYRNLAENPFVGIFRTALDDGTFLYSNQKNAEIIGYDSPQDLIGKLRAADFYPSEARAELLDILRREGKVEDFETELVLEGGTKKNISVSAQLWAEKGYLEGVIVDITERKRAEEELQKSKEKLLQAQYVARMGDFTWDIKTGEATWSDGMYELLKYEKNEIIDYQKVNTDIHHPDDLERVTKWLMDSIASGDTFLEPNEYRLICKDGELLYVQTNGQIEYQDGKAVTLFGTCQDITERKKAELALRESEGKYRILLEESPDPIFSLTPEGRYTYVNRSFAKGVGKSVKDIIGKKIWDVFPKDEADKRFAALKQVFTTGMEKVIEVRVPHPEGDKYYVTTITPVKDKAGHVISVICSSKNITDRKMAEEALRAGEEKFSKAFHTSPYVITITRAIDGAFIEVNDAFATVSGYSREEALSDSSIGLNLWNHPEDRAWVIETLTRGEIVSGREFQFKSKSGKLIDGLFSAQFIHLKDELCVLSSINDITERKQAEEELRKRESQLQRIFEILPIGLWLADKDGTLLRGNPAGVRIWGAEPKVPISEYGIFKAWRIPSRELIKPDDWALAKTISNGITIVDELLEIESFDGKRKTILNYTAPVLDSNGNVDGAIVVNLDISERQALEARLIQSQKMEAIGRLAGGVAHDFNNMLGVILGHTEMAMEYVDPSSPLHEDLEEIRKAAMRSSDLTRQLLAFARKQTIAPKVLDLNRTVSGTLKMLQRLIGENIDLAWMPGKELWPVKMDPSQIDQILANLCVNARDAIAGVGKITIETANATFDREYCLNHEGFSPGEYVLLAVSDNGCGMDQETMAHIYEPFFTTKTTNKGTGLGLATVYGIVKQNSGFINVYSEPGQGMTLKIYLPRHHAKAEQSQHIVLQPSMEYGNETILLVEDESSILKLTKMMLERLGYTVLTAGTPGEAIRIAETHPGEIHLLITDVVMPEMNGRDLAKNILSFYPGLKRLFMSGYTANVIAHHGILDEGVNYIQKPFSKNELAVKAKEVLRKAKLRD